MKSHSEKAAIASCFTYLQFALALVSGFVLFPLVVNAVGSYSYGLWLATGEAISYVLLGDLGVFAVLPWLIAGRQGASDFKALREYASNAIAIGCSLGMLMLLSAGLLLLIDPKVFGVSDTLYSHVLYPTLLLLTLNGLSYPFKAFNAILVGLQDVVFGGCMALLHSALTIALTVLMIYLGSGILGLAWATALPPLLVALCAGARVVVRHPHVVRGMQLPSLHKCRDLFREGFGAWLGGLGYRFMVASNGIILSGIKQPHWGAIYACTGKFGQVLSPICSTLPDSGLVGVSHVYRSADSEHSHRAVSCLALLYCVLPSIASVGLLIANPAIVPRWVGPDLYAGHYVNALLAVTLIVSGLAGGTVKLASVVGWRQTVGWTTIVAGVVYAGLGYFMASWRGMAGLAEASLVVWTLIVLPVGFVLLRRIYDLRLKDLLRFGFGRWLVVSIPTMIVAAWIGVRLSNDPIAALFASIIGAVIYCLLLRPLLVQAPWPVRVRYWLDRFSLVPQVPSTLPGQAT